MRPTERDLRDTYRYHANKVSQRAVQASMSHLLLFFGPSPPFHATVDPITQRMQHLAEQLRTSSLRVPDLVRFDEHPVVAAVRAVPDQVHGTRFASTVAAASGVQAPLSDFPDADTLQVPQDFVEESVLEELRQLQHPSLEEWPLAVAPRPIISPNTCINLAPCHHTEPGTSMMPDELETPALPSSLGVS